MLGIEPLLFIRGGVLFGTIVLVLILGRRRYSFPARCSLAVGIVAGLAGIVQLTVGGGGAALLLASGVGFIGAGIPVQSAGSG